MMQAIPIQGNRKKVTELREIANQRILNFITTTEIKFQNLRFTDEATNRVQSHSKDKKNQLQGIRLGTSENDEFVCTVDISLEVLRKIASQLEFPGCHDRSKEYICQGFVAKWINDNNNAAADANININNSAAHDGEEGKEEEEKEEETDTSAGAGANFADTFDRDIGNNDNDGIVNSHPLLDPLAAREQQQDPPLLPSHSVQTNLNMEGETPREQEKCAVPRAAAARCSAWRRVWSRVRLSIGQSLRGLRGLWAHNRSPRSTGNNHGGTEEKEGDNNIESPPLINSQDGVLAEEPDEEVKVVSVLTFLHSGGVLS